MNHESDNRSEVDTFGESYQQALQLIQEGKSDLKHTQKKYLTEELICSAVARNFKEIHCVPLTQFCTQRVCELVVMSKNFDSQGLTEEEKKFILPRAMKERPTAIDRIACPDQTTELKSIAIREKPACINRCSFSSAAEEKALQLLAVETDPRVILVMKNPRMETLKAALKSESSVEILLMSLKNSDGVIELTEPLALSELIEELGLELKSKEDFKACQNA